MRHGYVVNREVSAPQPFVVAGVCVADILSESGDLPLVVTGAELPVHRATKRVCLRRRHVRRPVCVVNRRARQSLRVVVDLPVKGNIRVKRQPADRHFRFRADIRLQVLRDLQRAAMLGDPLRQNVLNAALQLVGAVPYPARQAFSVAVHPPVDQHSQRRVRRAGKCAGKAPVHADHRQRVIEPPFHRITRKPCRLSHAGEDRAAQLAAQLLNALFKRFLVILHPALGQRSRPGRFRPLRQVSRRLCVDALNLLAGDVDVLQMRRAGGSHARFKVLVGHPLRHAAARSFPFARLSRLTRVFSASVAFRVGF